MVDNTEAGLINICRKRLCTSLAWFTCYAVFIALQVLFAAIPAAGHLAIAREIVSSVSERIWLWQHRIPIGL